MPKVGKVALDAVNLGNKYKLAESIVQFHKSNAWEFGRRSQLGQSIFGYPKDMGVNDFTMVSDPDVIIKNHQTFVESNNNARREAAKTLEMLAFQRDYSNDMADKIENDLFKPGGKRKAHLYKPGAGVPYYQMTQHRKAAKIAADKYSKLHKIFDNSAHKELNSTMNSTPQSYNLLIH